jgi:hypothetical protein
MNTASTDSAKQFLLTKLEEQALRDAVPLSDMRMFLFSEASASEEMVAAVREFDATGDSSRYEKKISKLLHRAFRCDKKLPEGVSQWKQSLKALKGEDFYGMVMLDQAGLPVAAGGYLDVLRQSWPYAAIMLAIGLPGFLLVFDPFRWSLIRSDWIRLILLPIFVLAIWYATDKYYEATFPEPKKRS